MTVLVVALAVAVGLLGLLVAGLLRSHAEILRALDELGAGLDPRPGRTAQMVAPPGVLLRESDGDAELSSITGTTPDGEPVTLAVTGVGHLTLLAFLSSTCLTCRSFWEAFADRHLDVPGGARVVIVTKGTEAESPSAIRKLAPSAVHTVLSSAAWQAYGIPGAPYFVLVHGPAGAVIGEGAAMTWEQVHHLMGQALADATDPAGRAGRSQDRRARVDQDLRAAGIAPGHPSLYPDAPQ